MQYELPMQVFELRHHVFFVPNSSVQELHVEETAAIADIIKRVTMARLICAWLEIN